MRKIEREMIEAINTFQPYNKDNTRVAVSSDDTFLFVELDGNEIAKWWVDTDNLYISDCGYRTKTTKSRLNCILSHFGLPTLYTKKGKWYLEDEEWKGNRTFKLPQKEMVTVMKS